MDLYVAGKHPAWRDFIDSARLPQAPGAMKRFARVHRPAIETFYARGEHPSRLVLWQEGSRSAAVFVLPSCDAPSAAGGVSRRSPLFVGTCGSVGGLTRLLTRSGPALVALAERLVDPSLTQEQFLALLEALPKPAESQEPSELTSLLEAATDRVRDCTLGRFTAVSGKGPLGFHIDASPPSTLLSAMIIRAMSSSAPPKPMRGMLKKRIPGTVEQRKEPNAPAVATVAVRELHKPQLVTAASQLMPVEAEQATTVLEANAQPVAPRSNTIAPAAVTSHEEIAVADASVTAWDAPEPLADPRRETPETLAEPAQADELLRVTNSDEHLVESLQEYPFNLDLTEALSKGESETTGSAEIDEAHFDPAPVTETLEALTALVDDGESTRLPMICELPTILKEHCEHEAEPGTMAEAWRDPDERLVPHHSADTREGLADVDEPSSSDADLEARFNPDFPHAPSSTNQEPSSDLPAVRTDEQLELSAPELVEPVSIEPATFAEDEPLEEPPQIWETTLQPAVETAGSQAPDVAPELPVFLTSEEPVAIIASDGQHTSKATSVIEADVAPASEPFSASLDAPPVEGDSADAPWNHAMEWQPAVQQPELANDQAPGAEPVVIEATEAENLSPAISTEPAEASFDVERVSELWVGAENFPAVESTLASEGDTESPSSPTQSEAEIATEPSVNISVALAMPSAAIEDTEDFVAPPALEAVDEHAAVTPKLASVDDDEPSAAPEDVPGTTTHVEVSETPELATVDHDEPSAPPEVVLVRTTHVDVEADAVIDVTPVVTEAPTPDAQQSEPVELATNAFEAQPVETNQIDEREMERTPARDAVDEPVEDEPVKHSHRSIGTVDDQFHAVYVPRAAVVQAGKPICFSSAAGNAISLSTTRSPRQQLRVRLCARRGAVRLATDDGLSFLVGAASDHVLVEFTGNEVAVHAALDGLRFTPTASRSSAASLTVQTFPARRGAQPLIDITIGIDVVASAAN